MKKAISVLLAMIMVGTVSVFGKTVSKEAPEYIYSGDKPLYPALIYSALHDDNGHFKKAKIKSADTQKNVYVFENVSGTDGLKLVLFTLTIKLDGNSLSYEYSDLQAKGIRDKSYSSVKSFLMFDKRTISNIFNTMIPQVMSDNVLYAKAKDEVEAIIGPQQSTNDSSYDKSFDVEYQVSTGKLLYPSFFSAYVETISKYTSLKYAEIKSFDILNNRMTLKKVMAANGLSPQMYSISIEFKDNKLHFEAKDFESFDTSVMMKMTDSELESIPKLDFNKIAKTLSDNIIRNDSDEVLYAKNKSTFLSNDQLLVLSVKSVTEITSEDFIKEIQNTFVDISSVVSDAALNNGKVFTEYKFRLTLLVWNPILKTIIGHIYFYTNDANLAKTPKDSAITIHGELVSYTAGMLTPDFHVIEKK